MIPEPRVKRRRTGTKRTGGRSGAPESSDARRFLFGDAPEMTDVNDTADCIRSLSGMTDLQSIPDHEPRSVLKKMRGGILCVPKEFGMFPTGA